MPSRVQMPSLSFVVARSMPGHIIGCENKLPWHLKTDLTRFKKITLGHVMIMGRKTHESIGRTLPGRTTIVLSRNPNTEKENTVWSLQDTVLLWADGPEEALYLADILSIARGKTDFFVIGGAEVFAMFSRLFDKVYLTEVLADVAGDAQFDLEFKYPYWQKIHEEAVPQSDTDQFPSRFLVFKKRDKTTRFRMFPDFLTDANARREWVRQNLPKITRPSVNTPSELSKWPLFPDEPS
jgi:dihydrofolate reductase